jgi:DNA primase
LAIWLDEYRNENYVTDKDGLFRSVYNRQASVKGTATSFQTKSFVVRGTLIISGEELPKDAGLLSRCIPLQFSEHQRNRQWFNWLNQHASQFSGFTFHLLLNYEHYKPQILDCIKDMKEALIEKGVTDRTAENWAICAGAFWAVVKQDNEFVKWIMESCQEATLIDEEANMLNQFWDDVNYLVSEGTIGDKYFRVENEKLLMWFEGIYVAWSIHYRKKAGRDPFDKVSIIKYLKDEPYYQGSSLKRLANTPRRVHAVLIEKAPDAVQEIAAGIAKYTNF